MHPLIVEILSFLPGLTIFYDFGGGAGVGGIVRVFEIKVKNKSRSVPLNYETADIVDRNGRISFSRPIHLVKHNAEWTRRSGCKGMSECGRYRIKWRRHICKNVFEGEVVRTVGIHAHLTMFRSSFPLVLFFRYRVSSEFTFGNWILFDSTTFMGCDDKGELRRRVSLNVCKSGRGVLNRFWTA